MNRNSMGAAMGLGLCAAMAGAALLSGCGRVGPLEQPAPLFGARAKAEYQQRKAAQAARRDQQQRANQNDAGSAERTDQQPPGPDNTPVSTRDVKDPNQQLTPASSNPIPGTQNNPFGAQPAQEPPVR